MLRRVDQVAKQVLEIVPEQSILHTQISQFIEDLWNQAPETLYSSYNWTKFTNVLNTYGLDDKFDQSLINQIHQIVAGSKS